MSDKHLKISTTDWADFRQEFGELKGLVDAIHDQTQKTNGRVTFSEKEIAALKTSVAVNKTKITMISSGIGTAIGVLITIIKDRLI